MKIIRWLSNWGSLYLLAVLLIGALVWIQSLNLKTSADDIISIGLLILFGFVVNSWIDHHADIFIDIEMEKFQTEPEKSDRSDSLHQGSERLN